MRENTDQNNPEHGHFLRSELYYHQSEFFKETSVNLMLFFEDLKYKGSSMAIQSSCERQYRMGQSDITTPVLALSQVFPGTV